VPSGEEKESYRARGKALWTREEWWHIVLFLALWAFLSSGAILRAYRDGSWGVTTFGYDLMVAFIWATFLMGIFFVRMFWGRGIISPKRMLDVTWRGSLVFGLVFVVLIYLGMLYSQENDVSGGGVQLPEGGELAWALVGIYFGGVLAGLVIVLFAYVICMGLVGMLYLFALGLVPPFLRRVRSITGGDRWYGRVLEWLFFIPENLDTGTLHASMPEEEREFPLARFRRAVAWQALFALLIAILVSLNPFLLDMASLETLFEFMNNAHVIVPILFLPILVFLRLRVRITGPVKDFHLYVGIRTRLVRTFLATGTVVLFIRLALEDLDPEFLLLRLALFSVISISIISAFTWLYFNFVENQLAFKVVERVPWLVRSDEVSDEGTGEEALDEDGPDDPPEVAPTGT
jgi:hypothetical protein